MTAAQVADGAAAGYRPTATLTFTAELRRQASRRRTQLALGFMVALPVVILLGVATGANKASPASRMRTRPCPTPISSLI